MSESRHYNYPLSIRGKKILLLAPHADDIEFSCGGTVSRLAESDNELWYVAFSPCRKSIPEGFDDMVLYTELDRSVLHLGISADRVFKYDYPVREFPAHRQEILDNLVNLRKEIKPDFILLPAEGDMHQDHHTIHQEGIRAFKNLNVLGYELIWNLIENRCNYFVTLDKRHVEAKMRSISEYKTQKFRTYSDPDFVFAQARVRGTQIGAEFAEAFELIRYVL